MKIIGVCGGSGAGKSVVSARLASFGGVAIDTDAIYHELISAPSLCVNALVSAFGDGILQDGVVDRNKLREIVFADEEKRQRLNQITHPFVMEEVHRRIENAKKNGKKFAVIDAPLLFEAGVDEKCDLVVGVLADQNTRIKRVMERDGISREEALQRISKQISDETLTARCDAVIRNNASLSELEDECKDLLYVLGLTIQDKE